MFSPDQWLASTGVSFYNGVATQSLRFDNARNSFLNRTPSIAGNQKTWTWSGWVKRNNSTSPLFRSINASGFVLLRFLSDQINLIWFSSNTAQWSVTTNALYRDFSAWYHIVVAFDTTQGTASNRVKIYVNGVQETSLATASYPNQNSDHLVNQTLVHSFATTGALDAYMAEVNLIDGQALDPTSFGETKNGVWIAKEYTGSYGTNGFRLQFNQTGTGTASSSTIGADTSGNTNHFTSSGIVASDCSLLDSPENNFATLNPLWNSVQQTYAEGNLKTTSGSQHSPTCSTIGVSSGKWYVEGFALSSSLTKWSSGIFDTAITYNKVSGTNYIPAQTPTNIYTNGDAINYYASGNDIYKNGSQVISNAFSSALTTNDIIQIAFDVDNGKIWYGINNSWNNGTSTQGSFDPDNHDTTFTVQQEMRVHFTGENSDWLANFGQDSSFAGNKTAQGNSDANGIGDFYYAPPSGFLALCSANLPEPTISPNADTQADDYFNTVLYTGTGSSGQAITGVGFQPDWLWIKKRSGASSHNVFDSSRGVAKRLYTNGTGAEDEPNQITSFDTDGFTINSANDSGATYVSWNWKANGGTTSSNTDGSITSTVQANTDAGFSIVTYTGNGSAGATVGHSLGTKPEMIILKERNASGNWVTYHEYANANAQNGYIALNLTSAWTSNSASWNNTSPTSSVFTLGNGTDVNTNNHTMLAYCFHSVEGYSRFGSYTGNGSNDGTFVHTGFRPAWVLIKRTDTSGNDWMLVDSTRDTINVVDNTLFPSDTTQELDGDDKDFVSNGFKHRSTGASENASGGTYIYMAFAENPFKYANAR